MEVKVCFFMCVLLNCILLEPFSNGHILFSNVTSIMEFDVDTRNVTVLVKHGGTFVFDLDYDYKNKYVYFPRYYVRDIVRFPYPAKNRTLQTVFQTARNPVGLAVDSINSYIYWISGEETLSRRSLDGRNTTVLSIIYEPPRVIRLDVSNRWMYIAYHTSGISKYAFDLAEIHSIVNFTSTPVQCMDIDNEERRLYWINYDGDMKSAKVDGSDVNMIISTHDRRRYYGIGVFDNNIYYSNFNQLLMVTKTQGSTPNVLYNDTNWIHSIFVLNKSAIYNSDTSAVCSMGASTYLFLFLPLVYSCRMIC